LETAARHRPPRRRTPWHNVQPFFRTSRHAIHQRKINELRPVWDQGLGHGSNTQILLQYQRIRLISATKKASAGVTTESGMQLWFWGGLRTSLARPGTIHPITDTPQ